MSKIQLQFPSHPFDYVYLTDALKMYRYPRNKIGALIKRGEIIRVKKGLYVTGRQTEKPVEKKVLANLIFGPAYISLEYALAWQGLIPERVEEVTCVTNKRNKIFNTPLGVFSYRRLTMTTGRFYLGVDFIAWEQTGYLMAMPERALLDKLCLLPVRLKRQEMREYLEEDLRIDLDDLMEFDRPLLKLLEDSYRSRNVSVFSDWHRAAYPDPS